MVLGKNAVLHLRWLAQQGKPMWGGHIERGEPLTDPDIKSWLEAGLIKRVEDFGYMITEKGLDAVEK